MGGGSPSTKRSLRLFFALMFSVFLVCTIFGALFWGPYLGTFSIVRFIYYFQVSAVGPLLAIPGFDISTIRMCSMHNVNLGLAQTCNGSGLTLVERVVDELNF